ncbi:transposase [Streptomyces rimosus subsp. rimosus]|nr:hypothetical protein CTZ40_40520 [Streptomyces rimosus]QEV80370.1 hypothetical protein CP984_40475 [Streptomyces rimosus]QTL91240.1 transposase [Streptomyces rimosus subsp. rimosus]
MTGGRPRRGMRHTVRRHIGLRVERAISLVMRARRIVRDYERLISHSEAHLTWAFITVMVSRLTLPPRLAASRRACDRNRFRCRGMASPREPALTSAHQGMPPYFTTARPARCRSTPGCARHGGF